MKLFYGVWALKPVAQTRFCHPEPCPETSSGSAIAGSPSKHNNRCWTKFSMTFLPFYAICATDSIVLYFTIYRKNRTKSNTNKASTPHITIIVATCGQCITHYSQHRDVYYHIYVRGQYIEQKKYPNTFATKTQRITPCLCDFSLDNPLLIW